MCILFKMASNTSVRKAENMLLFRSELCAVAQSSCGPQIAAKVHQTAVAKRIRYSRGGIPKILIKAHRICSSLLNPESSAMDSIRKCFNLRFSFKRSAIQRSSRSSFNDYRPMRMNEAPIVETHVVQSSEPPGGVGEVPTATVSPAVADAIFAATGKRIRKLPSNQSRDLSRKPRRERGATEA